MSETFTITIDGPAGSGKSTIAKLLAKQLHIFHLNSGAIYRAIAVILNQKNIAIDDEKNICKTINQLNIKVEFVGDKQIVEIDKKDMTPFLYSNIISELSSKYSTHFCIRERVVNITRELSKKYSMVLDGRDSGSYCLPDAKYKFYLDCDALERARRRQKELIEKGEKVSLDTIFKQLNERDEFDKNKKIAPLVVPKCAVMLDNTYTSPEQMIDIILSYIK